MLKVLFIIIILLTSCAAHVEKEKLYGRYVFRFTGQNDNTSRGDTLEIISNGTYHYWTFLREKKLENTGKWKLNSSANAIEFEKFSFLTDMPAKGTWTSRLKLVGDEVHLIYASEEGQYYKKID